MANQARKESQVPMVPPAWHPVVITTHPDTPPPPLRCPKCDGSLAYRATAFDRGERVERWDRLECRVHGAFVYRHRTRRLRVNRQVRP